MATFNNGESGLSVRTKINNVLQHADGTAGELVINEAGADVDFRVESDTLANALLVDGATGNVLMRQTASDFGWCVQTGNNGFRANFDRASYDSIFGGFLHTGDSGGLEISNINSSENRSIRFVNGTSYAGRTERMRIDTSGNLLVGTTSGDANRRLSVVGGHIFNNTNNNHSYGSFNETSSAAIWEIRGNTGSASSLGFVEAGVAVRWAIGIKASDASLVFASGSSSVASGTERLRIDGAGNLLIGTTSSGGSKLRISGLPTSSAGLSAGDVWNDAGTLKIA